MSTGRVWFAMVSLDSKLYAIGGLTDKSYDTNTVESYDPQTNQWKPMKPLSTTREGMGAAVLNDTIYVCGGYDVNTAKRHNDCEYMTPNSSDDSNDSQWHFTTPMSMVREYYQLVAHGGYLYAIGGYIGNLTDTQTVERYNPLTRQWQPRANLNHKIRAFAAISYMDKIYVCGKTCETYDPIENKWTPIASLNERRLDLQLVNYHDQLYAIGGQGIATDLFEVYNHTSNQWLYSTQSVPYNVYGFGAIVLDK
ncbi:kelch-like protein 20 [Oppia nitens]|uniref:kelch-like protein 20 n=1 Tax=Oppia nitens TaxID=1686743 RepID=UPI0023DAC58C|nr:kelch-like protein 20 [Oppia nitens]